MNIDTQVLSFGLPILLNGLVNTILFCSAAIVFGLVFASLIALARLSPLTSLRWVAATFVELIRNTPFLVQAFVTYFGLAQIGIRLDASIAGIVILSVYAAANFSESIRGAIVSVSKGQVEAARTLGMRYFFIVGRIILPQSLGYLIPALTNQIIGVIKDSAALSVITVPEVSMSAQIVVGVSFRPVEAYAMVALLYWLLTTAVAVSMRQIERKTAVPLSQPVAERPTPSQLAIEVSE